MRSLMKTISSLKLSQGVTNGKNYAGIGYTYDEARDAFIAPKPFDSWVLDEETCQWNPPTPYPTDGLMYQWVEADLKWQAFNFPTE